MSKSNYAVPTQKVIDKVYKNTTTFGKVKTMKKATKPAKKSTKSGFNPAKYERAKKSVFGIK